MSKNVTNTIKSLSTEDLQKVLKHLKNDERKFEDVMADLVDGHYNSKETMAEISLAHTIIILEQRKKELNAEIERLNTRLENMKQ